MKTRLPAVLGLFAFFFAGVLPAGAQWLTRSILVKPGWTAVYLDVDASHQSVDSLVGGDPGNPIVEIWLWQAPASAMQFVTSPQIPLAGGSQWANWTHTNGVFGGNLAVLVP